MKKITKQTLFEEMARIVSLPVNQHIVLYVNKRGEELEDPHFHIKMPGNVWRRLRMVDLSDLDSKKKGVKPFKGSIIKEIKETLLMPKEDRPVITNLEFAIDSWNAQEHARQITMEEIAWAKPKAEDVKRETVKKVISEYEFNSDVPER